MTMNGKVRKAIAAARLAVSAETVHSEGEAIVAAQRAAILAHEAGLTLDELAVVVPGLVSSSLVWNSAVDAWYDAEEQAPQALPPVDLAVAAVVVEGLRTSGQTDVARMMQSLVNEVRAARQ